MADIFSIIVVLTSIHLTTGKYIENSILKWKSNGFYIENIKSQNE